MTVVYMPRTDWYQGPPDNNSGSPRPLLAVPPRWLTRHYTGSPISQRIHDLSPGEYMVWMEDLADRMGKSFEYNYLIPPFPVPTVWEYAGKYQAAHSAGENDEAMGVLFVVGVDNHPSYVSYDPTRPTIWEPCTDQMVTAYRWLRDVHLAYPTIEERHHFQMPGAATSCSGEAVIGRTTDLAKPYNQPEPETDMQFMWRHRDQPGAYWVAAGSVVHLDAEMRDALIAGGVREVVSDNDDVAASYRAVAQGIPR